MPVAYRTAHRRPSGCCDAARSHCAIIAMRMMTYPTTTTVKSPSSKAAGTPAASTRTPAICTSVTSRYGTSSVS